jgi:predicted Zn-dependent peptidase
MERKKEREQAGCQRDASEGELTGTLSGYFSRILEALRDLSSAWSFKREKIEEFAIEVSRIKEERNS